ncbi:MAG: hypothetical protein R3282_10840 [Rhodothermales bacterium]|nr:hypothetical protein [Rhodothermales bacterium]
MTRIISLGIVALLATTMVRQSSSQTRWLPPRNYNSIVLEVIKPSFESSGTSFWSSAAVLTGQFGVGAESNTFITVDFPISHLGVDGGDTETAIGNPYVGVTILDANNPVIYEAGVRLPIASENLGAITGTVADFDRFEAYTPDNLSITGSLIYFPSRSGDWVLQTRMGPTVLYNTGDPGELDARADLFVNYSLNTWYFTGALQAGFGLSGRLLITDDASLSDRIAHQVGAAAQYDFVSVIPGVHIRLPLDDSLSDVVDLVFGVNVTVPL